MSKKLDWFGSILVRVYPRLNAAPDDLRTLAVGAEKWLKTGARQAGFRGTGFGQDQLDALHAGELPLPEALDWANKLRRRRRIDDARTRELAERMRAVSVADWLRINPEMNRRVLAFRVYGVGARVSDLFKSLSSALHAPAIARLEFAWEVLSGFDQIGERRCRWDVHSDA
jgi:hypothetical protein